MEQIFFIFFYIILLNSKVNALLKSLAKFQNKNVGRNSLKNNILRNLQESNKNDSYIILYFKEDCNYNQGFKNNYRNGINFVINRENIANLTSEETLIVHKNYGIEIHFDSSLRSLESFFDYTKDENVQYLVSIDFSNFDSSFTNSMASMFSGCSSLESIDLSNFDTSLVTDMSSMFHNCSALKSLDLSNFNTPLLTTTNFMFYNCSSLEYIDLSNFDTSSVIHMGSMFSRCIKIY